MTRLLTDWLDSYIELTKETEPPESFRLWAGISAIASALQRKCFISRGFETFYPNMYIVLLGPPASRKGVALKQCYYFLEELDISIAADATTRAALIKKLKRSKKTLLDKKTMNETIHSSLTIYNEEFTQLTGYQDLDFLTILVSWYDCGRGKDGIWENDTIARSLEKVEGVWVNILAASTPTLIKAALPKEGVGSGFFSRVIYVHEREKGKRIPLKKFSSRELELIKVLMNDLETIHEISGEFSFSSEVENHYNEWYKKECEEEVCLNKQKFAGYIGRRAGHVIKLMMILNASRTNSRVIELQDFERVLRILKKAERKMNKAFSNMGKLDYSIIASMIVGDISLPKV